MYRKNSEIQLYVDAFIIATAFSDKPLTKEAEGSMVPELISALKSYLSDKIDPNDKVGSVTKLLIPGAIYMIFKSLNMRGIGILLNLAVKIFKIDVPGILESILSEVKSLISGGKKTDSDSIDRVVNSSFAAIPAATQQDAEAFLQSKSFKSNLRDAQLFKLATTKNAGIVDFVAKFIFGKKTNGVLLSKAISWILKAILAAGGFMVAGDAMDALMGRSDKPETASTSTKKNSFKQNPSYNNVALNSSSAMWIEDGAPTQDNIKNMVLNWTEEVYPATKNLSSKVLSSAAFQTVVNTIEDYNEVNKKENHTFIPKAFSTKKQAVDVFIDDVASKVNSQNGQMPTEVPNGMDA